jgi:ATP-dependent Clp protease ATP-binding subunit ClpB
VREEVMGVVKAAFRPEFLNRVDEIILFHRLRRDQMGTIVGIQMGRLEKLLAERKIVVDLSREARDWLADKGYEPAYGARPLKRVIQKHLQDPLAEMILSGKVVDGQTVPVTVSPAGLMIGDTAAIRERRPAGAALN